MPNSIPVSCVEEGGLAAVDITPTQRAWAQANEFTGQRGRLLPVPDSQSGLSAYLFGLGAAADRPKLVTGLAGVALPAGNYRLAGPYGDPVLAAIGFRLGAYSFSRYRSADPKVTLSLPDKADAAEIDWLVEAVTIARNLINTPANDLGPNAFEAAIRDFAIAWQMAVTVTAGDDLLTANFP